MEKAAQEQLIARMSEKLLVKHVAYPDEVAEAYIFLMKCVFELFIAA